MSSDLISLASAAEVLGVHYMTAYRYVRTGRLEATKKGGQWWIDAADLAAVRNGGGASSPEDVPLEMVAAKPAFLTRAPSLLRARSIVGDEAGAWAIVSEALAYGAAPEDIYLKIVGPMMIDIGSDWRAGLLTISEEHRASVVVSRIIGRLSPQFSPRGRRRASIVLGAVEGEHHGLAIMMLGDLLAARGFDVTNLGANTPASAFVDTCMSIDGDVAVGVSAIGESSQAELRSCVSTLRNEVPTMPIFVGGPAGCSVASSLDINGFAATGEGAVAMFEEHFPRSRVQPVT